MDATKDLYVVNELNETTSRVIIKKIDFMMI
jgi:hypothetical protein